MKGVVFPFRILLGVLGLIGIGVSDPRGMM